LRFTQVLVLPAIGLGLCTACADASARYHDFSRRAEDVGFDAQPDAGGACTPPPPNSIEGRALLAVETTLTAGAPILFFGDITTPEIDGTTHVVFDYHPLDASDRATPLGETLHVGPIPIQPDGTFEVHMPEDTLPGAGNPTLPGIPITSELDLVASICGVAAFYCGTVSGRVTSPLRGEIAGRFGLSIFPADADPPAQPRYGCAPTDIAAPLPP
jgi:hypothetical protein